MYQISGIFRVGLLFAEFVTSLKSPKIDTAKNKLYYTSSLRVLEIAKIWLRENLTHLPSVIFAKISRREKFTIYGTLLRLAQVIGTLCYKLYFLPSKIQLCLTSMYYINHSCVNLIQFWLLAYPFPFSLSTEGKVSMVIHVHKRDFFLRFYVTCAWRFN